MQSRAGLRPHALLGAVRINKREKRWSGSSLTSELSVCRKVVVELDYGFLALLRRPKGWQERSPISIEPIHFFSLAIIARGIRRGVTAVL